jgi:hypothetical protein
MKSIIRRDRQETLLLDEEFLSSGEGGGTRVTQGGKIISTYAKRRNTKIGGLSGGGIEKWKAAMRWNRKMEGCHEAE